MKSVMNNLILISGAGRNVGKTTLCCLIIEKLKVQNQITAVKVTSHYHKLTEKQKVIYKIDGLTISEEIDETSSKDSARFLRSGAKKSLIVQVNDEKIPELLTWLQENITGMIICESGIVGQFVTPLKAIFVDCDSPVKVSKWDFQFSITKLVNQEFKPNLNVILKGII